MPFFFVLHEFSKLELQGAWEPPDNQKSLPIGEDQEALFGVPNGNQNHAKQS
jgi:hypothetical protein